jgi:methionyl-tRNA formyltransferase
MRRYILLSEKPWHQAIFENLQKREGEEWLWIQDKEAFTREKLEELQLEMILIPHWSYIIPEDIFKKFSCIVFHMTDLPYGRGGSPLQNLIVRKHEATKISAIRVDEGIDTGDVYLKKPLSLLGTAEEIFIRSAMVILSMITEILDKNLSPQAQEGEVVNFKRRKKGDGNIAGLSEIEEVYNYIRMLDAEGYPSAFLETEYFKFEFSRASLKTGETIVADVKITRK